MTVCPVHINAHLQELAKLRMMRAELDVLIEHEEQQLKQYMLDNALTEVIGEEHKAVYKTVSSSRLDSTALKRELPDIAARFTKSQSSMRFTFQ